MAELLGGHSLAARIFEHIDNKTTDLGDACWSEPVKNYRSESRLEEELERGFRQRAIPFCPSVALPEPGSYVAREAGGTPLLAIRGRDGNARVFRNACRHRGAQVASGTGRQSAFACRYHGWTYGLDGSLKTVPHEHGFPQIIKEKCGLVPVNAAEQGGFVFVTQMPPEPVADLPDIPELLRDGLQLLTVNEQVINANWKVLAESFIEGYHIRSTHRDTFYPVQYDNLNVVEYFGRNSRVTYPFRNIEKLRNKVPTKAEMEGALTHVYHLFPNIMIATFPHRIVMVALEAVSVSKTRQTTYVMSDPQTLGQDPEREKQATDFVDAGNAEDREVVESIQRGLKSGANEFFEFGLFEGAIVHFHKNLQAILEGGE